MAWDGSDECHCFPRRLVWHPPAAVGIAVVSAIAHFHTSVDVLGDDYDIDNGASRSISLPEGGRSVALDWSLFCDLPNFYLDAPSNYSIGHKTTCVK